MMQETEAERLRLDKWLWAARFFKTRALATAAVEGGKVQVDGARAKPSRALKPGDELSIRRGTELFVVTVRELSRQRGPAPAAQQLYVETEASRAAREALTAQRRELNLGSERPARRPDKKSRRQLHRFLRG